MKKTFLTTLTLAVALSMCSCGGVQAIEEEAKELVQELEDEKKEEPKEKVEAKEEPQTVEEDAVETETEETETEETDKNDTDEDEEAVETEEEKVEESADESDSEDEIRADFKAAMDEYEKFYDDYCSFMKKYANADPMDTVAMLNDYTEMLKQITVMDEKFAAWESKDLTTAETKYYIEVNARVQKKLLDAM